MLGDGKRGEEGEEITWDEMSGASDHSAGVRRLSGDRPLIELPRST
jgi:hypothetical protein